jgi:predicted transcriptional regulator
MGTSSGEGLEKLLFELASGDRLAILNELKVNPLKMNEVARKLDLTTTENFRQLQRLSEAKLIQKHPEGTYTLTEYGKLVLQLLSALEVTNKHRDYFLTHDLNRLPTPFVNRIGELSGATLSMDTIEIINKAAHLVADAEKYVWGLGDNALESVGVAMAGAIQKGVKFRFMFHESLSPKYKPLLSETKTVEKRNLTTIPAMIVCTEKEAAICLYSLDGRIDYTGFIGKDPLFVNWIADLFEFYWEKASWCLP